MIDNNTLITPEMIDIVLRFGGQIKLLDGRRDEAPPNTDSRSSSSAARPAAEPAPFDDDIPF